MTDARCKLPRVIQRFNCSLIVRNARSFAPPDSRGRLSPRGLWSVVLRPRSDV
jgi:hypothetical protein